MMEICLLFITDMVLRKRIVTFERRRINTFLQRVEVLYKTLKVVQNQTMERIATALL